MAQRGFNTVRFFLFWADFEPEPGYYNPIIVGRLKELVRLAQRHGLYCIPALLTIWMNGQLFDVPWRQGRDLWTDAEMLYRELRYIEHIATELRDADNILAYDLGDEVIHIDLARASSLSAEQAAAWQSMLANAIRQADPGALVFQDNEASAILGNHAFRLENSRAFDVLAIHGFPVWTPFAIESISCYKASLYVPFLVQMARLHGSVLVDEMGSYGADEETAAAFLRATGHSALANGACGIIVWCWQDFESRATPFQNHPNERFVGFLRTDGSPKLTMEVFQDLAARAVNEWCSLTPSPAPIAIYMPEYELSGGPNYLNAHISPATGAFYSYLLLKRAHFPCEFTRGPLDRYQLVICPSMEYVTLHDQEVLAHYVKHGGTLYYSAADYLHGFGGEELFGVQLKDFTVNTQEVASFTWQEITYALQWPRRGTAYPQIPLIRATSADVLAHFPNGTPALTRHAYGNGAAYYLNAPFEFQLDMPFRLEAYPWHFFYECLAHCAQVRREITVDHPAIEVALAYYEGERFLFLINHAPDTVEATFSWYVDARLLEKHITVQGKDVLVVKPVELSHDH